MQNIHLQIMLYTYIQTGFNIKLSIWVNMSLNQIPNQTKLYIYIYIYIVK